MKRPCVHVVPVGFEYDRIVAPILEYPADEVVLLRSSNEEYPRQHKLEDNFLGRLQDLPLEKRSVDLDIYDFEDMLTSISELFRQELSQGKRLFVNLSSAPSLELIALVMAASIYRKLGDIRLLYVKPKEYRHAKMLDVISSAVAKGEESLGDIRAVAEEFVREGLASGVKEIIELSPLPVEPLSDTERAILEGLTQGDAGSVKELVERIRSVKGEVPRSNVVYHLESLKSKNLVNMETEGKRVRVSLDRVGTAFLRADMGE
jgi:DNA-binding transcriptional ArsR family regulator